MIISWPRSPHRPHGRLRRIRRCMRWATVRCPDASGHAGRDVMSGAGLDWIFWPMTTIPGCLLDRMAPFRKTISDAGYLSERSCVNAHLLPILTLRTAGDHGERAVSLSASLCTGNWSSTSVQCSQRGDNHHGGHYASMRRPCHIPGSASASASKDGHTRMQTPVEWLLK